MSVNVTYLLHVINTDSIIKQSVVGQQDCQNYHNCNHQDELNTRSYATADAA